MANDRKNGFEGLEEEEIVKSAEWKQVGGSEKTKFEMKVRVKKV